MSPRPSVSVVMPFAGTAEQARDALAVLAGLERGTGDELIFVDNCGAAPAPEPGSGVTVVTALAERSPAHARNAGAERARGDWLLFLDADTEAPADLIARYLAEPLANDVGALAGSIAGAAGTTLAARYGAAKSFLDASAHLAHPYLPRAASANLLVRRTAFAAVGGFHEGLRAAEDTDFSWRLQRAGWRLEGRPQAHIVHRYRATISGLRRQWRGYAAGRAWLGRRYEDFAPEPALTRAAGRVADRVRRRSPEPVAPASSAAPLTTPPAGASGTPPAPAPRRTRGAFLALDALLGLEELAGFVLSNRPHGEAPPPADVVLVADRFPVTGDPLADYALSLTRARVEAAGRPDAPDRAVARRLHVDYREDDGAGARLLDTARLIAAHPWRCLRDLAGRPAAAPSLPALAPAVRRLARDDRAAVHALGPGGQPTARRLAALAGRQLR